MAKAGKVTITGVDNLERALNELGPKLGQKVIRQSFREALRPILAKIKSEIPDKQVAKAVKLRAWNKRKRNAIGLEVRIGDRDINKEDWNALRRREYGTKTVPAEPFMRPAFDSMGESCLYRAMRLIREGIDREVKG